MRTIKSILVFALVVISISGFALANGFNLNGIGSRAVAMGGAFVGLADDFSAVYWNPAGIAFFNKKTFGFYGFDIVPKQTYELSLGAAGLVDAETESNHYFGGMAAYIHPVNDKLVVGIGIFTPSGMGAEWNGVDFALLSGGNATLDWKSKVGVVSFSPVIAYKISDMFAVGASLNINYGMFDLAKWAGAKAQDIPIPPYSLLLDLGQEDVSMKGWGYGASFGVLVKPSDMISAGLSIKTPYKVKFDGDAEITGFTGLGLNATSVIETELTFPLWVAGGIAVKPIDRLSLTADLQWTQWSKVDVVSLNFTDPIWGDLLAVSGDDEIAFKWKDALQIRFGAEYTLSNGLAFRAGYYNDPSPTPDKTMNVLLPSYDFNVVTLGVGYSVGGLRFDAGLEYLKGKERDIDLVKTLIDPEWDSAMPGIYNMTLVVPSLSVSYSF